MSVNIPVSIGELWDKYTILIIKKEKIKDENKLKHIITEIKYLDEIMNKYQYNENKLFIELKNINDMLWNIEDKLRVKETQKSFDNEFIELARAVYFTNDKRAEIKKQINIDFDSIIYEIKDYVKYNIS
jgi:hypothetical protein